MFGLQCQRCSDADRRDTGCILGRQSLALLLGKKQCCIDCSHPSQQRHLHYLEILSSSHNGDGGTTSHQRYNSFVLKLLLERTFLSYLSLTGCLPQHCRASKHTHPRLKKRRTRARMADSSDLHTLRQQRALAVARELRG